MNEEQIGKEPTPSGEVSPIWEVIEKEELEKQARLREALIPSFWLTQLLLLIPGCFFFWLLYLNKGYLLGEFFIWNSREIWFWGTLIAILGMSFQLLAWRIFPLEAFDDGGVNTMLLELPISKLFPMFLIGAFSEELLVRGVL